MFSDVRHYVQYQIMNAPLRTYPAPHIYVEQIFPPDFYKRLIDALPDDSAYMRLVDTKRVSPEYSPQRLSLFPNQLEQAQLDIERRVFWQRVFQTFGSEEFAGTVLAKFQATIFQRFMKPGDQQIPSINYGAEVFLMRDLTNYSLGPHTDSPAKLVSVLFYLPSADDRPDLGTSLYVPKDRRFTCPGGPHHPFELFERVITLPYRRNALLAFPKTSQCFHGVEPVATEATRRDLMLFDIKGAVQAPPQ
jgi:hypothetical protein